LRFLTWSLLLPTVVAKIHAERDYTSPPLAYPVRFINGGKSLLVGESTTEEVVLTRVDLADGHRTPWKRIKTEARNGLGIAVTPDLKYYAYAVQRYSSDLYVVDNLR
jgi:hypothetical protein